MSKLKLALVIFFVLLVLIVSADENGSLENNSLNESVNITKNLEDSAVIGSLDGASSDVSSEDNEPASKSTEPIEINQPQIEEGKSKALSASFGVYLNIVG